MTRRRWIFFFLKMYVCCGLLHCAVQIALIQPVISWSWNLAVVVHWPWRVSLVSNWATKRKSCIGELRCCSCLYLNVFNRWKICLRSKHRPSYSHEWGTDTTYRGISRSNCSADTNSSETPAIRQDSDTESKFLYYLYCAYFYK